MYIVPIATFKFKYAQEWPVQSHAYPMIPDTKELQKVIDIYKARQGRLSVYYQQRDYSLAYTY